MRIHYRRNTLCALLAIVLVLLALPLTGCSEITLSSLLTKESITSFTVCYTTMGTGDAIPQTEVAAGDVSFAPIVNALYEADPVTLKVTQVQSYSPELNASHLIYLHTAAGSMPVYYDQFQALLCVPYMRKDGETQVLTYLCFQPSSTSFSDTITALEPVGETPQSVLNQPTAPTASYDLSAFTAPDDSALRATVTPEMLAATGDSVPFEGASNAYSGTNAVYQAFAGGQLAGVADGRAYLVACPASTVNESAAISSITNAGELLLVRVLFSQRQDMSMNAALIDASVLGQSKTILFLRDDDASVLYVQQFTAPAADPADPTPVDPTAAPADAPEQTPAESAAPEASPANT